MNEKQGFRADGLVDQQADDVAMRESGDEPVLSAVGRVHLLSWQHVTFGPASLPSECPVWASWHTGAVSVAHACAGSDFSAASGGWRRDGCPRLGAHPAHGVALGRRSRQPARFENGVCELP